MHLDLNNAVSGACFTATTFDVKAVPARLVASHAGFWQVGKQIPDEGEHACVRGRIRPRSATDGALVNIYHFVNISDAFNCIEIARLLTAVVQLL